MSADTAIIAIKSLRKYNFMIKSTCNFRKAFIDTSSSCYVYVTHMIETAAKIKDSMFFIKHNLIIILNDTCIVGGQRWVGFK